MGWPPVQHSDDDHTRWEHVIVLAGLIAIGVFAAAIVALVVL